MPVKYSIVIVSKYENVSEKLLFDVYIFEKKMYVFDTYTFHYVPLKPSNTMIFRQHINTFLSPRSLSLYTHWPVIFTL